MTDIDVMWLEIASFLSIGLNLVLGYWIVNAVRAHDNDLSDDRSRGQWYDAPVGDRPPPPSPPANVIIRTGAFKSSRESEIIQECRSAGCMPCDACADAADAARTMENVTMSGETKEIELGQEVRDKITHFAGILAARTTYLHGQSRCAVQSFMFHEGKPLAMQWFDEQQLELFTDGAKTIAPATGSRVGD